MLLKELEVKPTQFHSLEVWSEDVEGCSPAGFAAPSSPDALGGGGAARGVGRPENQ